MSIINDGGPAFPRARLDQFAPDYKGMNLRDWFAGQALASLVSRHRADVAWSDIAPKAYLIADAMLAERLK